jgi:AcrR family transcriptional regulator
MARKHLDAVRRGPGRIDAARAHFADAILAAKESGETIDDICEAAGLGRTKVYELINEAKRRRGKE